MAPTPQDTHLQIIRQHYPDLQPEQITSLTGGNDHIVFVIDQQTIFCFPLHPEEELRDTTNFVRHFAQPHANPPLR